MARAEVVGALSPASPTADTPSTPLSGTPARTPASADPSVTPAATTPVSVGSPLQAGTPVLSPTTGTPIVDSPPKLDKDVAGAPEPVNSSVQFSMAMVASPPPAVDSPPRRELSLKTAMYPEGFCKLDENGEPLKEQERFSYQNMLVRYADWKNVRGQVLAILLLQICLNIYSRHLVEAAQLTAYGITGDGRSVHCHCNPFQRNLTSIYEQLRFSPLSATLLTVLIVLLGGLSPLWERFIGRRRVLMGLTVAAIPASIFTTFKHVYFVQQLSYFTLQICSLFTMLITTTSLIEMLPYETRYIAPYNLIFSASIASAIGLLHIRIGYFVCYMATIATVASVIGLVMVRFFITDSICHLNIRNEIDVIDKKFRKCEKRLHLEKREGSSKYHELIAKKVLEDLVYLDQDELNISSFYKRIWRNFHMIDIVLAIFQSISAGAHEFEYNHFINERFNSPFDLSIDRLLGFALTGVIQHFARKTHRNKALCWMFAAMLCNSAARHSFVRYDKGNQCASIHVVATHLSGLSLIFSIVGCGLSNSILCSIILHFLETTPSVLRSTCVLLVYIPYTFVSKHFKSAYPDKLASNVSILMPLYLYHILIICLTMMRASSRLPFALYLFDLMPPSQRDNSEDSDENIRPMMEHTGVPKSTEKEKTGGDQPPAPMSQKGSKEPKKRLSLKKMGRIMRSTPRHEA